MSDCNDPAGCGVSLSVDVDGAFPDIVRKHQHAVYAIALRWTGHRTDAEDAAQETFLRAYKALKTYSAERRADLPVRPWLATIALNVCRNRARAAARRPTERAERAEGDGATARNVASSPDRARSPSDEAEAAETAAELAAALRELPDSQRRAVVLHSAGGLTYAEVARALDRPEGTVKADVSRGLQRLRSSLRTAGVRSPTEEPRP